MAKKGVKIKDLCMGAGREATRDSNVTIRFDCRLNQGDQLQSGVTMTFRLGARRVIAGLEKGVEGMRVGGVREFRVSPHLAYGQTGIPGKIPENAILIFTVELLEVLSPEERESNKRKDQEEV